MLKAADHFREREKAQDVKDRDRRKWFVASRQQQQRAKEDRLEQEEDLLDLATSVLLADPVEVRRFQAKLDTFDEATIKALMENQKQLDAVNARLDDMLERAHKLDDGRRVFKTEDGQSVFDEHGAAVSENVVHPNEIPDHLPKWQPYKADRVLKSQLEEQREQIHEFQEKVDAARVSSDADDLTQDELESFEAELEESMPESVAQHMPDYEAKSELSLSGSFGAKAAIPAVSANVAPTSYPSPGQ